MYSNKALSHYGPVTAVKFDGSVLYVGHGPSIKAYDWIKGVKLWETEVLSCNKVHGIVVLKNGTLVAWGARSLSTLNTETKKVTKVTLKDWIIGVAASNSPDEILALSAHNDLLTININTFEVVSQVQSQEQSILYSGTIHVSADSVLVGSGTVLHGVVVWDGKTGKIIQQMTSHEGSIFGVAFSADAKLVASCSDDRSIRVYDSQSGVERWTGWGHMARIWQLQFVTLDTSSVPCLLSASEDCTARIWTLPDVEEGSCTPLQCTQTFEGHIGKNVWAADICCLESNKLTVLATAGGDGGLRLWDVNARAELEKTRIRLRVEEFGSPGTSGKKGKDTELFKDYAFAGDWLVAATSKGRAFICDLQTRVWTLLLELQDTYPIVSKANFDPKDRRVYILARCLGQRGVMAVVECGTTPTVEYIDIGYDTSEQLSGKLEFVPCGGLPERCTLVQRQERFYLRMHSDVCHTLVAPDSFAVTAAYFDSLNSRLYLGSRHGALATYVLSHDGDVPNSNLETPVKIIKRRCLSDDDAITSIDLDDQALLVTGRTGHYALLDPVSLLPFEMNKIPRGTIEGSYRCGSSCILYGFRTDQFFMWDIRNHTEVFAEKCGGGHRIWNIFFHSNNNNFTLGYTKAGEIHVVKGSIAPAHDKFIKAFLQPGFHGREIRAAQFCPVDSAVLATGGEDTLIKLCRIGAVGHHASLTDGPGLNVAATYGRHVSGIQSVSWTPDGKYLITTSAREELFIWTVTRAPRLCANIEHVLPVSNTNPDLRIMDTGLIAIQTLADKTTYLFSTIYSDSSVKLWRLETSSEGVVTVLLDEATYSHCCILTCEFVKLGARLFLLTSATDGFVSLWDVVSAEISFKLSTSPVCKIQIHQSGVKSGIVRVDSEQSHILYISGGDDNAISAARFVVSQTDNQVEGRKLGSVDSAHSCTITNLAEISTHDDGSGKVEFVSVATDQRIKRWIWNGKFELCDSAYTTVADTGVCALNNENLVFVGGSGSSLWQL